MFVHLRFCFWNWLSITYLRICKRFDIQVDVKSALLECVGTKYSKETVIEVAKYFMNHNILSFNDYCDIVRECAKI